MNAMDIPEALLNESAALRAESVAFRHDLRKAAMVSFIGAGLALCIFAIAMRRASRAATRIP